MYTKVKNRNGIDITLIRLAAFTLPMFGRLLVDLLYEFAVLIFVGHFCLVLMMFLCLVCFRFFDVWAILPFSMVLKVFDILGRFNFGRFFLQAPFDAGSNLCCFDLFASHSHLLDPRKHLCADQQSLAMPGTRLLQHLGI